MTARRRSALLAVEPLDERTVPAAHAAYSVTSDWGTGFQAQVKLSNDGPAAVSFDKLQFTLPSAVTSVWDAKVIAHVGTKYTVTSAGWNAVVPAGGSVSFGFVATKTGTTAAADFVLNGVALDPVTPPPPVVPPVVPAGTLRAAYRSTGDWGTGGTGEITITNTGPAAVTNWKLGFNLLGPITSLWNGTITSHVGTRYAVAPPSWGGTIPAGGSVTVGFTTGAGGLAATELTVTADGTIVPPSPPVSTNRAPVAAADSAATTTGQAVTVAVLANDTDADGDKLAVTAVGTTAHGTVTKNSDGSVTYAPAAGFAGSDSFAYTVSDGHGGTTFGTVTVLVTAPPANASKWPAQVTAPYVDATLWPTYDFVAAAKATGVKYYTLAFVTADPQNKPAWGGYASYCVGSEFGTQMGNQINALRALGGDVAVSFGGAAGRELAEVVTDVNQLAAAYRSVIQVYGLTHIDFDIEGAATNDKASVDRRNQAIALLQSEAAAAGKELNVRYTLPVLPTGLTADGLSVLQSAKKYGVRVDVVNVMAMDYGDGAAPNPQGKMGDYAIQAATSLYGQLTALYGASLTDAQRWAMIGVTPMIGMNDIQTEIFDQQEARELVAWAESKGIGLLAFWSANRDRQNANGAIKYVDLQSSSLIQSPNEFALIFNGFTAG